MFSLIVGGTGFPGGIRKEMHDLLFILLTEVIDKGYELHKGWCWGFGCRPIKNPDGSLTDVPSNHSWGLAIDVNAPENAFGGSSHTIPASMVRLFKRYGFRWGGEYLGTKDWMHFEFMGSRRAAARLTRRARAEFLDEDFLVDGKRFEQLKDAMAELRARLLAGTTVTKIVTRKVRG